MSGLNDDFELDEPQTQSEDDKSISVDETLFAEVVPGEVPDVDPDVSIAVVVGVAKDLDYLRHDIINSNGMTQSFAVEAAKLIPGFLSEDRPVGYFTSVPTKTLLKVSLEAIEDEKKSILKRIWDAIVEFLKKAVDWAKTLFKNLVDKVNVGKAKLFYTKDSAQTAEGLDTVQKAYDNPKNVVAKVQGLVKDKTSEAFKVYVDGLEEKLSEGNDKLLRLYASINGRNELYAIATSSSVIPKILNIAYNASEIISSYKVFDKEMLVKFSSVQGKPEELAVQADGVKKAILTIAANYEANTFVGYAQQIQASLAKRDDRRIKPETMPLSKLYKLFGEVFKKYDVAAFMKHLNLSRDSLEEIQRNMTEITTGSVWSSKDREANYSFINEVFRLIYGELRGLLQLISITVNLFTAWSWIADAMTAVANDFKRRVTAQLAGLDEESQKLISEYFDVQLAPVTDAVGKH